MLFLLAFAAGWVLQAQQITSLDGAREALQNERYAETKSYLQGYLKQHPKNAEAAYLLSIACFNLGDFDEQFRAGDIVLSRSSSRHNISWVYQQRGLVHYFNEEYEQALNDFSNVIKYAPDEERGYDWRTQLYIALAFTAIKDADAFDSINMRLPKSKAGEKHLKLAEQDAQKLLNLNASSLQGLTTMGSVAYLRRDEAKAEQWLQKAIAAGSTAQSNYTYLFSIYLKHRRYADAADLLISIIDRGVKYPYTHYYNHAIGKAAFQTLLARYQIQANKQPNDGSWPYYIGLLYSDVEKNYDKAADYFKKAYAIEPQYSYTANAAARAFLHMGNYDAAIAYARRAIAIYDSSDAAYLTISSAKYYSGQPDSAVLYITQAIRLDPTDAWYYYSRGFYNKILHRYDDAIDDYSASIELVGDYAHAYKARGDMYLAVGKRSLAEADYRKAIALDSVPQSGSCAMYAYLALGETDKALDFLNRYMEADDDKGAAYYEAACIYALMGRTYEALQYLEKSFIYGNRDYDHMQFDTDLDSLRDTDAYRRILETYKPQPFPEEVLPPLPTAPSGSFNDVLRSLAPHN